jgi:hypothetical protein
MVNHLIRILMTLTDFLIPAIAFLIDLVAAYLFFR